MAYIYQKVTFIDEYPAHQLPEPGEILVVGSREHPKWAFFRCPCGCEVLLSVNFMKSISPCWDVDFNSEGAITVAPSIRHVDGCGSHFFIRANRVEWA